MRRPDAFRQRFRKNDQGEAARDGWTITENGRRPASGRVRRHLPLLWMLRLAIVALVLFVAAPYLHVDDLPAPLARLLEFRLSTPVDSGDRNGLLHK